MARAGGGEVGWLEQERRLWMASQGQEVEGLSGYVQGSHGPLSMMEARGQFQAGQQLCADLRATACVQYTQASWVPRPLPYRESLLDP